MLSRKEYVEQLVSSRKKFISKLEELLGDDGSLKLRYYKLDDLDLDIIAKNEAILVIANENFKNSFEKVDFDLTYDSKGEDYKVHFKNAYEQCKAAVKSNGNISLNSSAVGVVGPLYDPKRHSNGYVIYNEFQFNVNDLFNLDNEYFSEFKDLNKKEISINELVRLIYNINEENRSKNDGLIEIEDEDIDIENRDEDQLIYSRNKILFGPPGTGKSYNIKSKMNLINVKDKNIIRTTFHPEYSYYEFVGQYKPVVAYEKIVGEIRYTNSLQTTNEKAFVYYDFVPGPFIKAVVNALKLKESSNDRAAENTLLIVEEINRGNSSAIFGDVFQLLDRINDVNNKHYGESEYSIDVSIEIKEYIKKELGWEDEDWNKKFNRGFIIPSNLYIYATMNTSDQSLYPIDSAFKRRWDMEYMYIDYEEEKLVDLYLPEPYTEIKWLDFIRKINEKIVEYTEVDDKQLGQWFVGNSLSQSEFLGKVVSYLWFDIFRYDPEVLFKDKIKTFDDVRTLYNYGIFKNEIINELEKNIVIENKKVDGVHEEFIEDHESVIEGNQ